ncbi:MAG TPA: MFS transporter [Anaerolineaceae bacterium]|nr:MFS transporter [Anaerolineaceae bacterium]
MLANLLAWSKKEPIRRTFAYYSIFLCLGMSAGIVGPTLPSLAAQTGSPLASMGLLFMVGSAAYTIGVVVAGRVFDRLRGHPVLGIVQLCEAVIFFLIPFVPWFWLLLGLFCVRGIAESFILTGSNTMLIWTHGEKVSPFMNGLHFFFGLGAFISPLLVAQAISAALGYSWAYRALAVIMLLFGLRMLTLSGSPQPVFEKSTEKKQALDGRAIYPFVFAAALFLFFYVGAEVSFSGWFYTYSVTLNLANAATAAYLTSAFWLSFTISRLISIPIAVRYNPRQVLPWASISSLSILLLAMFLPHSLGLLWLMAVGLGFCMAPIWPTGFTLAGQSINMTGRISGIVLVGDSLGGMLLPWFSGQVIGSVGAQVLIYLVFGAMLMNFMTFAGMVYFRPKNEFHE